MSEEKSLFGSVDESWCEVEQVWWALCLMIAVAIPLGFRAYVHYMEDGMSASEIFALRANLITFASIWFIFAVGATVLAVFSCKMGDVVSVFAILVAEFVGMCLWHYYVGNGDLVRSVVQETRERMSYLLVQGLGMNETEMDKFWKDAEDAVVSLWTERLKTKPWRCYTTTERDELLFDTGIECGKVLQEKWEGVLHDVLASFNQWRLDVEQHHRIRVPEDVAKSLRLDGDSGKQALLCVAIIIANEDERLRKSRNVNDAHRMDHQFCGGRIARRKTAAEGILRWPDVVNVPPRVTVTKMEMDKSHLWSVYGNTETPYTDDHPVPFSVLYTLNEIIRAGYIRIPPDGIVDLTVTFKHGNMVFDKFQWNSMRTIEYLPFRFISSATWMAGDVAFMVEQRELVTTSMSPDGSGYLGGKLKIHFEAREEQENGIWIDRANKLGSGFVWGYVRNIPEAISVHPINVPMMWILRGAWMMIVGAGHLARLFAENRKLAPDRTAPDYAAHDSLIGVTSLLSDEKKLQKACDQMMNQMEKLQEIFASGNNSHTSLGDENNGASTSGRDSIV